MSYGPKQSVGDLGISIASLAVQKLGWIFREQTKADHGIDAHLEIVEAGIPTGKLIALQIKSGPSYLKQEDDDCFVFREKTEKLHYWSRHSLPVLVLLVDPATESVFWESVDATKIRRTKKGWKLNVPKANVLTEKARGSLELIADRFPGDPRWVRLFIDLGMMRFLQADPYNRLFIEAETWLNKLLPRTRLRLLMHDAEGEEEVTQDFGLKIGWNLEALVGHLFPWAEASIDEDHYSFFENEDSPRGYGYENWRPYEDNGEIGSWRLELVLNELGRSFLVVSDYLTGQE